MWAFYPESNQRTLEEMDLVFASDSIWNWDAEKNFARLKAENPDLIRSAHMGHGVVGPETGVVFPPGRADRTAGHDHVDVAENVSTAKTEL